MTSCALDPIWRDLEIGLWPGFFADPGFFGIGLWLGFLFFLPEGILFPANIPAVAATPLLFPAVVHFPGRHQCVPFTAGRAFITGSKNKPGETTRHQECGNRP
jgi:hypothetical protein